MMGLSENLKAAQEAVAYVKSLNILAINKRSDRISAAGGIDKVIGTEQGQRSLNALGKSPTTHQIKKAAGPLTPAFIKARYGGAGGDSLRKKVKRYIDAKAGNCTEQADIAILYLFDNHYPAAGPISKMEFTAKGYDHAWVVVGLADDFDKSTPPSGSQNLRNWGADAVWCDPWQSGGVAFPISDLVKGAVRNLSATYKCNTADRVADGAPEEVVYIGP